jgi:Zn-dependent protease with chaperone function
LNATARFFLLLALAWPLAAAAQLAPMPDRVARLDGHDALRARADAILARLVDAGQPLTRDAHRHAWDVQVVARGVHDAEAFDGGQIRLSAAFVARLGLDDAELAMLLAHEVAHVLAGDAGRRAESAPSRASRVLGDGVPAAHVRAPPSDAVARRRELDADALGFALATRAGFPAEGLRGFYRKVLTRLGNLQNATHPPVSERWRRLDAADARAGGPTPDQAPRAE